MKIKIGAIILALVCIGLAIALFATKKAADEQRKSDAAAILDFSNQLDAASISLNDVRQVNLVLTNDLSTILQSAAALSNRLLETSTTLSNTKESLTTAEGQISNLNGRITDLEAQNKALDDRAAELTNKLAELSALIASTQRQLTNAEADNVFLTGELQKQLAQKAELERKFNDLNVVRAQVTKLRDELFVTRRLEWMANGANPSTPMKGAAALMLRSPTVSVTPANSSTATGKSPGQTTPARPASPYDLNVEVGSDGSVHVIPPATNNAAR